MKAEKVIHLMFLVIGICPNLHVVLLEVVALLHVPYHSFLLARVLLRADDRLGGGGRIGVEVASVGVRISISGGGTRTASL